MIDCQDCYGFGIDCKSCNKLGIKISMIPSLEEEICHNKEEVMFVYDYESGDCLRRASKKEEELSKEAAKKDGGAGVIELEGRRVYVI